MILFLVDPAATVEWFTESSMVRVKNATVASGMKNVSLSLCANEYESFQIVLRSNNTMQQIDVQISNLTDKKTGQIISNHNIEWHQVGFVYVEYIHSSAFTDPVDCSGFGPDNAGCSGWYPDPLLKVAAAKVLANYTTPLWFTVQAPTGTPVGVYSGQVTLSTTDLSWSVQVPLSVNVWDITLPKRSTLRSAVQVDPLELRRSYPDLSAVAFDSVYRRHVDYILGKIKLSPLGPYRGTDALSVEAIKSMRDDAEDGAALPLFTLGCPDVSNASVLSEATKLVSQIEAANLTELAYFYGYDESNDFQGMQKSFGALKKHFPNIPTVTTAHFGKQYGASDPPFTAEAMDALHIDYPCPQTDYLPPATNLSALHQAGRGYWTYISCQPYNTYANVRLDNHLIDARLLLWQIFQVGSDAWLYWGLNQWEGFDGVTPINTTASDWDPRLDPKQWRPDYNPSPRNNLNWIQGDGRLLYSGVGGEPLGSIRLENLRDSVEDYEMLSMLARKGKDGRERAMTLVAAISKSISEPVRNQQTLLQTRATVAALILQQQTTPGQ